ncbi:MAG TPA: hypothetical protein VMU32_09115 [Solirubrobacteraceae bacterium]|nr:hypothetical protein [Solirubrobacteraceae bacterium]
MPVEVKRTLVKSPPELWAEISDPASLARHLGELGEIRTVRTEPETSVEWEATDVRGTVDIEPSGWGTRVTLSVVRETPAPESAAPEPEASEPEPEPVEPEPARPPRRRLFARLFRRRHTEPEPIVEPEPVVEPEPEAAPDLAAELAAVEEAMAEQDAALLTAVLDRLGAAHHRPFSRG